MLSFYGMYAKMKLRGFLKKKKKGEVNYFLAIAIGTAVLLIVLWPLIRGFAHGIVTAINEWFDTNQGNIFGTVPGNVPNS